MRIRHRLSLAFFLISVLPLAVVTLYSYYTAVTALRRAAETQADQMATEMGERMTFALADLGDRVQRIWMARAAAAASGTPVPRPPDASSPARPGQPAPTGDRPTRMATAKSPGAGSPEPDTRQLLAQLQQQVNDALAEAAPMVDRLEFMPSPRVPSPPAAPAPGSAFSGRSGRGPRTGPPPDSGRAPAPWFPPADPQAPSRVVVEMRGTQAPPPPPAPGFVPFASPRREDIESWRRAIDAQMARDRQARGTGPAADRAEAARDAARAKRRDEYRIRLKALASGEAVKFPVQMDGTVVGEVNAQINRHRMIEMVLGLARRERGEVPFVLDIDDEIHTLGAEDVKVVQALKLDRQRLASMPGQTLKTVGDWVAVTRHDESGIVFGIARPLGDSLRDMRRAALGNLGLGLLLIVASFAVILPLASRLTRHVTALTEGVQRLGRGERATRVAVASSDEVGELAQAFNRMAGELEAHEKVLVEQERLRRELELCRQIQVDMLPREPLRLGLAEVTGVSIPAREVGGDFFNYFGLPGGALALIVGDVSGKGVGAALLMANIQATLRARLPLELDLPALVDAVDRDVAETTPNEVYLTLFIAILDPVRGMLRYVNAGHNPQYLLRANGTQESMPASGLPVGLLPGHGYQQHTMRVHPGDLIFLYTDGATEAEDETGDMFGHERLQQALADAPKADVTAVLASVESVIRDFRGTIEPFDDATMMAVRVGVGPVA